MRYPIRYATYILNHLRAYVTIRTGPSGRDNTTRSLPTAYKVRRTRRSLRARRAAHVGRDSIGNGSDPMQAAHCDTPIMLDYNNFSRCGKDMHPEHCASSEPD